MSPRNQNSAPFTPELPFGENFTGLPDDLASKDENLLAAERGIRHAKDMLVHPENSVLPNQQFVDDVDAPAANEQVKQSIIGSRANHGPISDLVQSITDVSASFGNPEGRSPAALRRQQEIFSADLNSAHQDLETRKRRGQ